MYQRIVAAFACLVFQYCLGSETASQSAVKDALAVAEKGSLQLQSLLQEEISGYDADYFSKFPFFLYRVVTVPGQGRFYIDNIDDTIKNCLRSSHPWESYQQSLIEQYVEPGSIAVDIGSHIGTHTLTMAKSVGAKGSVYAFEPNQKIYRELCFNLALNGCTNVFPLRCAVGKEEGVIEMVGLDPKNEGGAYVVKSKGGQNTAPMIRLDDAHLTNVSFIKIDVENMEAEVLEGAIQTVLSNRPVMLIEIQGNDRRPVELGENIEEKKRESLAKIKSLGYTVYPLAGTDDCLAFPKKIELIDLSLSERKESSQNGEDGVIEAIFDHIGVKSKYYIEFGTYDWSECNTRFLFEKKGWSGLLMDGGYENPAINLHKEWITSQNINSLFEKYNVPKEPDLLSIDIDFNDFYVWQAISNISPRVVVIEYNATHKPCQDKVVVESPLGGWDGSNYFGASILALYNLGRSKGYTLVYAESMGVNLFFVRDDVLEELAQSGKEFIFANKVKAVYRAPRYGCGPMGGHSADAHNRPYCSSETIIKGAMKENGRGGI